MLKAADCLIEIQTEELPPKTLLHLAEAFKDHLQSQLMENGFNFAALRFYATPRRLALFIEALAEKQPDQLIEKRGPALKAAYDAKGQATPACIGFARSLGVPVEALTTIKSDQGEWVASKQLVSGKAISVLLPAMVETALHALPISKRMRWDDGDTQFVRPIHHVILLYDDAIVPGTVLGCQSGRVTRGHRFLAPEAIIIPAAALYASLLETEGWVIADVEKRRAKIKDEANAIVKKKVRAHAKLLISSDAFLDEVTNLVEWPVALCGEFDATFLSLPQAVLISAMQDHQRYFPVLDQHGKLLPYFVTISNIPNNHDSQRVIVGNQRVLRARLADAAFFYAEDKKLPLAERVPALKNVLFQNKLGTLWDKTERLKILAGSVAKQLGLHVQTAERAAFLAKADLVTNMVNEFPALQGVMGHDYALHDKEAPAVAVAIEEHYLPRVARDKLPADPISQVLAIADRMDTLVGIFGIHLLPTGDKDPYGLRRAALGVLRILIEKKLPLDLSALIAKAQSAYEAQGIRLENSELSQTLLSFMLDRLRGWYQEQNISNDVFAAVAALKLSSPLDIDERIRAVQQFKQSEAALALSVANKRVSNLLSKYQTHLSSHQLNAALFETGAEAELATQLALKQKQVAQLKLQADYAAILRELAELREPVDHFFDQVMVMTDDQLRRDNRLHLLAEMRALFLQVADIALLQD